MFEDRATIRTHIARVLRGVIRPAVYGPRTPLDVAAHHVHGEPIPAEVALARPFEPFALGQPWGAAWDTSWFRLRGTVPPTWAGSEVVARVDLGHAGDVGFTAEGLIWRGAEPVQGLHHRHRDYVITDAATGGENVELFIEAAANPPPPWASPDWPLLMPDPGGAPIYTLQRAELAVVDRDVEALWFDMHTLTQLVDLVPEQPRNNQVLQALHDAVNAIDPHDVPGTAKAARQLLAPMLDRPALPGHRISAVGHAHIDSAWLWPIRETKRKCARTFANQLRLLELYPEHRFACSQAQQYEWMKEGYPTLWERIKEQVACGRWEPVGGMWVESDTNVPSGESLVRQLVYGKRFFADEFGIETHELWIPDVFGYSAALPQIAAAAGVTSFVTQKMSWNGINRFPHHTFWWEGHDGSRLFTHFPPAATYNGEFTVGELTKSVSAFADHGRSDRSLYPYGYGDGGGGPTREMLEYGRRMSNLEGLPAVEIERVDAFLDQAREEASRLDVWVGELYLESHRGTYTTQADTKRDNRRSEEALRAAEMWAVAAATSGGRIDWSSYPHAELDRAWKLLLLNQFHDIIPGSGIHWVYEDARRDYAAIQAATDRVVDQARGQLALAENGDVVTVFNPASHPRNELVELPTGLSHVSVPACGWTTVRGRAAEDTDLPAVRVGDGFIENAYLRVEWDGDGLLRSVWDKKLSRQVIAAGGRGNLFQLHEDQPNAFDAWDVDLTYLDKVTDLTAIDRIEILDGHPLRAGVRFERRFARSSISQVMRLDAGSRRVEFHTAVDWQERHRFLKVAFPVAIRSSRATYEIQHGHIERPTIANTSWDAARFEVCAHRWADLSEPGYGVALLNDSKYGYDIRGNTMRLSLLRGPGYPDPEADRGRHQFAYALLPHPGDLRAPGAVITEAEAFNLPLAVLPGAIDARPLVSIDRPGISVEAVKKADRSEELVVRLCEVWGSRGPARIELGAATNAGATVQAVHRTDLLERDLAPVPVEGNAVYLDFRPFELVTLKFQLHS